MAGLAYDARDQTYPQEYFFSETYAFLTWETGGTVWDIDHAIGKNLKMVEDDVFEELDRDELTDQESFQTPRSDPDVDIADLFRAVVVDDIFEKIRLQMVDFDGSGRIDLAIKDANDTIVGGDFVEFFEVAAAALATGGTVAELEDTISMGMGSLSTKRFRARETTGSTRKTS